MFHSVPNAKLVREVLYFCIFCWHFSVLSCSVMQQRVQISLLYVVKEEWTAAKKAINALIKKMQTSLSWKLPIGWRLCGAAQPMAPQYFRNSNTTQLPLEPPAICMLPPLGPQPHTRHCSHCSTTITVPKPSSSQESHPVTYPHTSPRPGTRGSSPAVAGRGAHRPNWRDPARINGASLLRLTTS